MECFAVSMAVFYNHHYGEFKQLVWEIGTLILEIYGMEGLETFMALCPLVIKYVLQGTAWYLNIFYGTLMTPNTDFSYCY
jgi:hypothetical protein